jgi:Raf kinase inhibitor-like YbhB/YbcL family protein
MFPADNTCAGTDVSPAFDWTPGPAGTQSYALVLTDMFQGRVHWVLWDIPAATRSLPAMLATTPMLTTPPGARQMAAMGMGYTGPCPGGSMHTYQFDLHAVDVATLPVTAGANTTQLKALVMSHSLAKASLSAPSSAK